MIVIVAVGNPMCLCSAFGLGLDLRRVAWRGWRTSRFYELQRVQRSRVPIGATDHEPELSEHAIARALERTAKPDLLGAHRPVPDHVRSDRGPVGYCSSDWPPRTRWFALSPKLSI
jgi:hypothetical protein